jgi:hypothetical protein
MSYVKVNVARPAKASPGSGGDKKNKVTIVDVADILTHQPRDSKGILISGKHVFKAGAYAIELYVTPSSIAAKNTGEGEIDAEGVIQEFVFAHPGTEQEILEFRANWLGKDVLIFDEACSDGRILEYGGLCAPLRMKFEGTDDKDAKKTVFTFTSTNKGPNVAIYNNTLTLSDVTTTVAADATFIDLTNGSGEYQLTDNTIATQITTCSNASDGLVFTLLGSGGTNPASIVTGGNLLLKDGTSWSGIAGATITFKAFKDGGATFKYFELSRT